MSFSFHGPPSALVTKGSRGPMSLFASADLLGPYAQAGGKRGGIAAHKYEGLTSFQRTIPRFEERLWRRHSLWNHTRTKRGFEIRNESKRTGQRDNFSVY